MWERPRLVTAVTTLLVVAAVACVPASQQNQAGSAAKTAQSTRPAPTPVFEVLVQYKDGTKTDAKVAVRKSVNGTLKESLDSPSGASGLEVLIVPRSSKYDSIERVVSDLRRNKAVRVVEPQQVYSKQPSGRL
jgi:hypothetical protein